MSSADLLPTTQSSLLLLVAALLAMWLLLRVRRHERVRRERRSPTTLEELGRVVFEVARGADIEGYRDLFLAGGEAAAVLGEEADAYLARRNLRALEESLITLGALIPEGAVLRGVEQTGPDRVALVVVPATGPRLLIEMGSVVRLGGVFRLREPAGNG